MLFFRRMSPHWLFSVIIIIIVDVGHPCERLSVLSSAFAVASLRQIRPDLYIQGGLQCTWELNAYSSYITLTNETHLQSCHYIKWNKHSAQVVSNTAAALRGGGHAHHLRLSPPPLPPFGFHGKIKIGISFLYSYTCNSHCFQGTQTVQSGTFNCAFQSTLDTTSAIA